MTESSAGRLRQEPGAHPRRRGSRSTEETSGSCCKGRGGTSSARTAAPGTRRALGVRPTLLVGDMDSIDPGAAKCTATFRPQICPKPRIRPTHSSRSSGRWSTAPDPSSSPGGWAAALTTRLANAELLACLAPQGGDRRRHRRQAGGATSSPTSSAARRPGCLLSVIALGDAGAWAQGAAVGARRLRSRASERRGRSATSLPEGPRHFASSGHGVGGDGAFEEGGKFQRARGRFLTFMGEPYSDAVSSKGPAGRARASEGGSADGGPGDGKKGDGSSSSAPALAACGRRRALQGKTSTSS